MAEIKKGLAFVDMLFSEHRSCREKHMRILMHKKTDFRQEFNLLLWDLNVKPFVKHITTSCHVTFFF